MDTKALRQKILDLAIRGKLVPQDPNDEPASVLLERIREQRQQMVKEGKLKKKDIKNDSVIFVGEDNLHYEKFTDGTVKCIEDEIPFDVPEGWSWCRYSDVIELYSGQDLTPDRYNDVGDGIPYITGASNLVSEKVLINRWTSTPTTHATKDDLLLTVKGSGVGKMAFCDITDAHIARQIMALRCTKVIKPQYLYIVISSMLSDIIAQANGIIPGIRREIVLGTLLPLPSLREQEKICEKAESSLRIINLIENEKDDLKEFINKVKSKILDLAIRGQLVPQNPDDEPASALLERIRAEKEELIKQGKIKRDKKESFIFKGEDNSYYDGIPVGWTVCYLKELFDVCSAKRVRQSDWRTEGVPFYRAREIVKLSDNSFVDNELYISEKHYQQVKREYGIPQPGDLMVSAVGTIGKVYVVKDTDRFYYKDASVLCFENRKGLIDSQYAKYMLMSKFVQNQMKENSKGTTVDTITISAAMNYVCLIPPVNEQKRIVSTVEQLLNQLNLIELELA
ncbi:MAG: restriction endonuclease subunit S [Merdimonas faecis]|uniref:restriction endonuclease subunit S n=1 Tax=Merdimonas faecis TaxID=1653435 RepID=UPI0039904E77